MRSIELYSYLLEAIERAFRKIGLGDVSVELSKPPALDMGDLALPCFKYSSILKKPPIEKAQAHYSLGVLNAMVYSNLEMNTL